MGVQGIDRLRDWLDGQETSAAFLTDPVSIGYLTGFHTNPHERLMALVVGPAGAVLVVPGLEAEAATAAASGVEVRAWKDGDDPWLMAARALGSFDGGRVGVEKDHLSLAAWGRLKGLAPAAQPVDVGAEVRRLRLRKTPEEVRLLEQAAAITDQVTDRVLSELRAGRSELEVAAGLDVMIAGAGARPSFDTLVQSGPNSALPHSRPSGRRLQAGDLVLLDFGAAMHGYKADTTRMAVVGPPTPRQAEVHAVVLAANAAGVAAVRPGATAGQVDHAARAVIESAGLGEKFIHRTGHGLGLEAHEEPSLEPGGSLELEPGMVVTIEPGVYIAGWGGVRIEDDVVVTESGCDLLTKAPRELRVIS